MIEEFKQYIQGNKNFTYEDKKFNSKGINYLNMIFINKLYLMEHINEYENDQLRILFYIYLYGYKNKYLHTNLNIIRKDLNISEYLMIKAINELQDKNNINVYSKNFELLEIKNTNNLNETLNLELNVDTFISNKIIDNDFIYLPIDYINNAINELTGKEFLLLARLILLNHFYNYYTNNYKNLKYDNKNDCLKHHIFSYTTLLDEAKNIKVSRGNNINSVVDKLKTKKYINIKELNNCYFYDGNNFIRILNTSYVFQVCLFTRIEYIYYYTLFYDNMKSSEIEYLKQYYKKYLDKYRKILYNNDKDTILKFKKLNNETLPSVDKINKKHNDNHKTNHSIPAKLRIKMLNKSARWVESEQKYIPACQFCGKTALESTLHVDHIIPYSKGGETIENNLQVLCEECNEQKNNKYKLIINRGN